MQVSITSNHNRDLGKGQTGNLAHNRRDFIPRNVDGDLIKNNTVFKSRTLAEVYEEAFGDAIDDYNRKQRRRDRRKYDRKSYFKHLFGVEPNSESAQVILTSNARGKHEIKSFNEELFQVGDCYAFGNFKRDKQGNFIDKDGNPVKYDKDKKTYCDINGNAVTNSKNLIPNPNAEIAKRILCDFYEGGRFKFVRDVNGKPSLKRLEDNDTEEPDLIIPSFEERNPNFRVTDAVMHNDEWHGTPHIHIDYIPIGEGYTKGPEKQVGFERALKNMGFDDKNTAYKEWREKERRILKEICGYYGLETKIKEEENNRGKTYAPDIYSETVRAACADAQAASERIMDRTIRSEKAVIDKAEKDAAVIRMRAEIDACDVRKKADEYVRSVNDEVQKTIGEASQVTQELKYENSRLTEENKKIRRETEDNRRQLINLMSLSAKMPKRKICKRDTYTMDKETYNSLMDALSYHSKLINNTLTSDEDRQAAADERERQQRITADMERNIQRQASQMIAVHMEKLNEEYERNKEKMEYEFKQAKIKAEQRIQSKYKNCLEYYSSMSFKEAIIRYNNSMKQQCLEKTVQGNAIRQNENDDVFNDLIY